MTADSLKASTADPVFQAENITVGYHGEVPVVENLNIEIPHGEFTAIIGPNGCGKSTLLRALGRLLTPTAGRVLLGGTDIKTMRPKDFARHVSLLPQAPTVPDAITVKDLVARGRFPHQSLLRQWSPTDVAAVDGALTAVGMTDQAHRQVNELSGGQRQRVWIAMSLAQETETLLLDEPTTFLDISHQLDVLELCLNLRVSGRTIIAVLHDLNLAARYATHVVAMNHGQVIAQGSPDQVFTPPVLKEVFDLDAVVITDPETGTPLTVPRALTPAH